MEIYNFDSKYNNSTFANVSFEREITKKVWVIKYGNGIQCDIMLYSHKTPISSDSENNDKCDGDVQYVNFWYYNRDLLKSNCLLLYIENVKKIKSLINLHRDFKNYAKNLEFRSVQEVIDFKDFDKLFYFSDTTGNLYNYKGDIVIKQIIFYITVPNNSLSTNLIKNIPYYKYEYSRTKSKIKFKCFIKESLAKKILGTKIITVAALEKRIREMFLEVE